MSPSRTSSALHHARGSCRLGSAHAASEISAPSARSGAARMGERSGRGGRAPLANRPCRTQLRTHKSMGLQGGDAGAKAFRALFQSAHSQVQKLPDVRTAHKRRRSETLAVVDGNVLLMAVPVAIDTFDAFVAVIATQIASAVKAAAHVVVVFDEPKEMTKAKVATQQKRDRSNTRKAPVCSSDLAPCPTTDDYTLTDLKGVLIEDAGPDAIVVYRDGNKMYAQAPVNVQLLMETERRGRASTTPSPKASWTTSKRISMATECGA